MRAAGADVVKIAVTASSCASECADVLSLLTRPEREGVPTVALSMGERGQLTRLLAGKFGGFLTFAALPGRSSAPGQPDVSALTRLYRLATQTPQTRAYGIVGNPVSQSKSPLLHNNAFQQAEWDGVYVPLLIDDLPRFLRAFPPEDPLYGFEGLSVTIPHKGAALAVATEADEVAGRIGAANTLVLRREEVAEEEGEEGSAAAGSGGGKVLGGYKAYNTDWIAAIAAIEKGLAGNQQQQQQPEEAEQGDAALLLPRLCPAAESPLRGRAVVVVGAGGAGRALAFGAASRGARVIVANRTLSKAKELAQAVAQAFPKAPAPSACDLEQLASGAVQADVVANTTSVGMVAKPGEGDPEATPVPLEGLRKAGFCLVFDAVYTPRRTRLLRDAEALGLSVVDGVAMFVGQAAEQYRLFTREEEEERLVEAASLMEAVVMHSVRRQEAAAAAAAAQATGGGQVAAAGAKA
jgi:3-dehydroquinate dehydratase / shikimate dehydrogenase